MQHAIRDLQGQKYVYLSIRRFAINNDFLCMFVGTFCCVYLECYMTTREMLNVFVFFIVHNISTYLY